MKNETKTLYVRNSSVSDAELAEKLKEMESTISYYVRKYSYLGHAAQEDIRQECNLAVLHAMELYNEAEAGFVTYASKWIQTYVYDFINHMIKPISQSRDAYRKAKLVSEYFSKNPNGTIAEASASTGLSKTQILDYMPSHFVSLDKPVCADDDTLLGELVADNQEDYVKAMERRELLQRIDAALDDKERDILYSSFGIGCDLLSQSELAEKYHVSHQAVSKMLNSITKRLRSLLS